MSDDDFETSVQRIEAMAARLSAAAQVFREAGLILRGGGGTISPNETGQSAAAPTDDAAAHRARQFQPPEQAPNRHPVLSAAEINQRNALLGRSNGLSDEDMEALKR